MNDAKFTPNGKARVEDVETLEEKLRIKLPENYRTFLIETNGGTLSNSILELDRPGDLLIDCFFGFNEEDSLSINYWIENFSDEIPEGSLIIGSDAGGGFLLLCTKEEEGIYYYDHSYSFQSSSDNENTYYVCAKFTDLTLKLIGKTSFF